MTKISIDRLNEHLFSSIEMLMAQKDPNASENEKIDVETAKAIADIGKVVIDGYKVKAQVLNMMRNTENPTAMKQTIVDAGIITEERIMLK